MRLQQGFTLIEVLLALVIVAVSSFIVVMNIPVSGDDEASLQARQLYHRLQLMNEEALLSGQEFGVWVSPKRNEILLVGLTEKGWLPLEWSRIKSKIDIADDVVMDFNLGGGVWQDDGRLFQPSQKSNSDNDLLADNLGHSENTVITPQILIMSSGELTPFTLHFYPEGQPQHNWTVQGSESGELTLIGADEASDD
jgi:general secretion pathway protein H